MKEKLAKIICAVLVLSGFFSIMAGYNAMSDVSDCRTAWEDTGSESGDDLQTLIDGLHTLEENEADYKEGKKTYEQGMKDYEEGMATYEAGLNEYYAGQQTYQDGLDEYNAGVEEYEAGLAALADAESKYGGKGVPTLKAAYTSVNELMAGYSLDKAAATVADAGGSDTATVKSVYSSVAGLMKQGYSQEQAVTAVATESVEAEIAAQHDTIVKTVTAQVREGARPTVEEGVRQNVTANVRESVKAGYKEVLKTAPYNITDVAILESMAEDYVTNGEGKATVQQQVEAYLASSEGKALVEAQLDAYLESTDGKATINAYVAAAKDDLIAANLPAAKTSVSAAYTNVANLMGGQSYKSAVALAASATGEKTKTIDDAYQGYVDYVEGQQAVKEGKAALTSAERQLAQGRADLTTAEATLAEGEKSLADAQKQLKEGKESLDEFEEGSRAAADGVALVLETEAVGNLQSIAERLGDGFTYTDKDGLVIIDKGFEAIEASNAYGDDNTAAVTDELTGRAYGAIALLIAGAFAVIAGIVGIAEKKRIAGIIAILALIAGITGAVFTINAGDVMSAVVHTAVNTTTIAATGFIIAIIAAAASVTQFITIRRTA